jgi:hypothetical protein
MVQLASSEKYLLGSDDRCLAKHCPIHGAGTLT